MSFVSYMAPNYVVIAVNEHAGASPEEALAINTGQSLAPDRIEEISGRLQMVGQTLFQMICPSLLIH